MISSTEEMFPFGATISRLFTSFLNAGLVLSNLMDVPVHTVSYHHFSFWGDTLLIRKWAERLIDNSDINILSLYK